MARQIPLQFIQTTSAALTTQAAANGLLVGEPYYLTDNKRIAYGLTANSYGECAALTTENIFTATQTFSGGIQIDGFVRNEPVTANSGAAYTIADKSLYLITLTANCTFTFPTPIDGNQFTLALTNSGTFTVTWPSSAKFAGGTAPTLTATAGKTDVISFVAMKSAWVCFANGLNYSL